MTTKTRFTVHKYDPCATDNKDDTNCDVDELHRKCLTSDDDSIAAGAVLSVDESPTLEASECNKRYHHQLSSIFRSSDDARNDVTSTTQEEISTLLLPYSEGDQTDDVTAENIDSTATLRPSSNRYDNLAVEKIAKHGRLFAQRQQRRLVFKDGTCNVSTKNILERKRRYLVDIFTTFVDMKWRFNILLFGLAFIGSWFAFALVWWVEAVIHEDYRALNDTEWPACVKDVYDFPTALLFSIETQHTIGYGSRAIETNCWPGVVILMLQSCYGVFVQSLMTGLIFAKLSRPKRRAQTMMFSKTAVICQRDNEYCLLFRLGDMRRSHIIGTSIRALFVKNRLTKEGESIPLCQYSFNVETETNFGDNFVFLVWPVTIVHRIVKDSPLWEMTEEKLLCERFEIIVIFEGIVENTGMTTQFRTSYLPSEILWGHRLEPLVTYCKTNGQYDIDFKRFHETRPVNRMPECSAREFAELQTSTGDSEDLEQNQRDRDFPINFTARISSKDKNGKQNSASNASNSGLKRLLFRGHKRRKVNRAVSLTDSFSKSRDRGPLSVNFSVPDRDRTRRATDNSSYSGTAEERGKHTENDVAFEVSGVDSNKNRMLITARS